jgi:hypothetical protein
MIMTMKKILFMVPTAVTPIDRLLRRNHVVVPALISGSLGLTSIREVFNETEQKY